MSALSLWLHLHDTEETEVKCRDKSYLHNFPSPAEAEIENATKLIMKIWACHECRLGLHVPVKQEERLGTHLLLKCAGRAFP